jgi:hypothetical protein
MDKDEDEVVGRIVCVFSQAIGKLRKRGLCPLEMKMEAMDLLMDHATSLGPEGLADVMSILALDRAVGVTTRAQVALSVSSYLETQKRSQMPN